MQTLFLIYKIMSDYLLIYLLGLLSIICTIVTIGACVIAYAEIKDYFKNS
jgi:hypothetical protein